MHEVGVEEGEGKGAHLGPQMDHAGDVRCMRCDDLRSGPRVAGRG